MKEYKPLLDLFIQHLQQYRAGLERKQPPGLYSPEDYILSLGGKRLRPLLALIACDLFDKDPRLALNSALCVELFHNFSLIHDDILDKAPLRRNQATVHKKWGLNTAILSGDVMLVKAFQQLENYGYKEFKKLSPLFSQTAVQVCEGQQLDMDFEKAKHVEPSDYITMISLKTAVLLGCSLKMGGINAYAGEKDLENLYAFGKHLGIAFQLMDDYLDAFADDNANFGKQPGGDIISNKKTFLLLKSLELADTVQTKELNALLKLKEKDSTKKIKGVLAIYDALNIAKLCESEADKHTQLAINYLDELSASKKKKDVLKRFSLQLLKRGS